MRIPTPPDRGRTTGRSGTDARRRGAAGEARQPAPGRRGAAGTSCRIGTSIRPTRSEKMTEYSTNPAGERFPLPERHEYAAELQRLEVLALRARDAGQEVVVVMGVGFVGAVMGAMVADSTEKAGGSRKCGVGGKARTEE